jgi:hypothetical protein
VQLQKVSTHCVEPTTMVDATLARECSAGNGTLIGLELSPGLWTNLTIHKAGRHTAGWESEG